MALSSTQRSHSTNIGIIGGRRRCRLHLTEFPYVTRTCCATARMCVCRNHTRKTQTPKIDAKLVMVVLEMHRATEANTQNNISS